MLRLAQPANVLATLTILASMERVPYRLSDRRSY
jgi:hypothetical protein